MQNPTPSLPMASLFGPRSAASKRCAKVVSAFLALLTVLGLAAYHPSVKAQALLINTSNVAAGGSHTCALTASGGVKCWGSNSSGQLGDGSTTPQPLAIDVSGLSAGVVAIAAGREHTCALTASGGVKCWGNNGSGQLGDNSTTRSLTPVDVIGLSSGISAIATGREHTCAITASRGVKCWGSNVNGQLGNGSTTQSLTPVDVLGLDTGISAIATGGFHTCARTVSGGVKCWGNNIAGQLGNGSITQSPTPVNVSGLDTGISAIATGGGHTCALTASGGVKCWGSNRNGQLGDNSTIESRTAVDVIGLGNGVSAIATGGAHTCAISASGGVKCWGSNAIRQLGDGSTTEQLTAIDVSGLSSGVSAIATSNFHTCALTTSGGVKCWGDNRSGQLGDGSFPQRLTATDVIGLSSGVNAIAAGGFHTCALTASGGVKCWGDNISGQLGDDSTNSSVTSVDVFGLSNGVGAIDTGREHTCARTVGGGVKCWGFNFFGQLGNGSTTDSLTARDVSELSSGASAIATGDFHTCAVTTSGGGKCWGFNDRGELGDNTTTQRLIPVDVIGLGSGISAIATGSAHTCARTVSGGVRCWGDNAAGQLGTGSTIHSLIPVDVVGLAGVRAIATGGFHTCALTESGAVKCWGDNQSGQLGNGSTTNQLTAIDVSGLSAGVVAIATGGFHTCALTESGAVKCWGYNQSGQLGDGSTTGRLTPVEVSGLTNISAIATGVFHTCALTASGGAKCWGAHAFGQLGIGGRNYGLPGDVLQATGGPIAIPATSSWSLILLLVLGGWITVHVVRRS